MRRVLQFGRILLLTGCALGAQEKAPAQKPTRAAPDKGGAPKAAPGGPKGEAFKKGGGNPNRLPAPNGQVDRLLAMTPEQRDRVLEKLPAAQQERLRKRFEQFDKRSPEERARLLNQWKRMESLPPEKRQELAAQLSAFNALPDDRRAALRPALVQLSRLSPEEREARLNNERFKSRFSPAELQMLSVLSENYTFPPKK
jgi:hypothetical protein